MCWDFFQCFNSFHTFKYEACKGTPKLSSWTVFRSVPPRYRFSHLAIGHHPPLSPRLMDLHCFDQLCVSFFHLSLSLSLSLILPPLLPSRLSIHCICASNKECVIYVALHERHFLFSFIAASPVAQNPVAHFAAGYVREPTFMQSSRTI